MNNIKQIGRILGLDIGKKRIGSALSDELRITSSPFKVFEVKGSLKAISDEIVKCCKSKNVTLIIIGMPLEVDGSRGEQAMYSEQVIRTLASFYSTSELSDLPLNSLINLGEMHFFIIDERFTSVQAESLIKSNKHKNKDRREIKDNISASILIETYLSSLQNFTG